MYLVLIHYMYVLQAKFRRCDQRNLNYSPLCSLIPKFSPVHWQKPIKEIYEFRKATPSYIRYQYLTSIMVYSQVVELL